MLEFARRVERVDIHHCHAGAQDAGGRNRILQHVRHHDGDAVAKLQAAALQIGGKVARQRVEFAIGDRLVHADESLALAKLGKALLQQRDQRVVLRSVDLVRHAGRIMLQPDAVHRGGSPVCDLAGRCRAIVTLWRRLSLSGHAEKTRHSAATGSAHRAFRPFTHSSKRCTTTNSEGTNSTARQVEAIMPVNTVMPIDLRALAPAPVAITSGTTERMKAIEVIRIGRKRARAASTADWAIGWPSLMCRSRATSTIRIAFLADSAISRIKPIWT